jgi:hypothetical protein
MQSGMAAVALLFQKHVWIDAMFACSGFLEMSIRHYMG